MMQRKKKAVDERIVRESIRSLVWLIICSISGCVWIYF